VPEYSIEFGGKLAEVADLVVADGLDDPDAGDRLHHFPPAAVAQMASKVVAFAGEHWQSLQTKTREGTADGTSARP
jgi:hypothetical protein